MTSQDVQNLFSSIATRYALVNHVLSFGMDFWWRWVVARQIERWQPRELLDIATGNGELAFAIAQRLPTVRISAIDFCAPMLAQASEKQKKGKGKQITFLQADGLELPFKEHSFDVATISFGLRNMRSWEGGLHEMNRVLRPGGHLLILDFSIPTSPLLRPLYRFYLHFLLPYFAGLLTGEASAYHYMGGSIEAFPSGEKMCALLENCGFQDPQAQPLTAGIVTIYRAKKEKQSS